MTSGRLGRRTRGSRRHRSGSGRPAAEWLRATLVGAWALALATCGPSSGSDDDASTNAPGPPSAERAAPRAERSGPGAAEPEATPSSTDEAALAAEVRAAVESYYAALSARDWEAFAEHFWPGATLTTVWQPPGEDTPRVVATTVPDFVAQAPMGPGSREIFEETLLDAEIRVAGGLAQVWARYHARFGDPGDLMEWEGTDAFTLLKHEGHWRITGLAYRSD